MDINRYIAAFYVLFWLIRINGCVRRGRQPLLRGSEWFFNVHVQPDFYAGPGRKILHRYWLRMLVPFAVDIPLALAIFLSGRLLLLQWLILGLCALIHINHSFSVNLAEREAQPFASSDADQPVVSMALSLTPRRLRDYTNRRFEWALTLSNIVAFAGLLLYYFAAPESHNLRFVFAAPAFLLYLQLGMMFAKHVVVAWRSPVPAAQAVERLEAREEARKHYLRICDWGRTAASAGILFWLIELNASPAALKRMLRVWLAALLIVAVVGTVWVELRRKHLVTVALRVRPAKLPDFLRQSEMAKWPVCYQPSAPMLVLKGSRGYSLNLANTLAYFGAAYLAGLIVLLTVLPVGR
jgi:hypothetical protein